MIKDKEEFEKVFPNLTLIPREEFLKESKYSSLLEKAPGHFVVTVGLFERYDSISFPLDESVEEFMRQCNLIYEEQLRMQKLYPHLHLGINSKDLIIRGVWVRNDVTVHGECLIPIGEPVTENDLIRCNEIVRKKIES
jgi:hypothetical protein